MKKILLFFALIIGGFSTVITAADTFDPATNTLTLDSVTAGGIKYPTVVVRLNQFTVLGVGNSAPVENGISETCEAENFTLDKFGAIQEGMSIEQITQIIGCKDEERRLFDEWIAVDWTASHVYTFAVSFIEPAPTKFIVAQFSGSRNPVRKTRVNLGGITLSPIGTTGTTNNTFDPTTNVLTMDSVWVTGGLKYENVAIHLDQFTLLGVAGETVVPPPPPPPPVTPPPPPPPPVIPPPPIVSSTCSPANFTIDKYNAIQVGMSLDQVNQIIGCSFDSSLIVRIPGYVSYQWNYFDSSTFVIKVIFDGSGSNVTGSLGGSFKSAIGF